MNLQQTYMGNALKHVKEVEQKSPDVQSIYRGLTHQIPAYVLTNGLALTVAFITAKSKGDDDRAKAYKLIGEHIKATLFPQGGNQSLNQLVQQSEIVTTTFTLLDAWVYYKRFAVSFLADDAPKAKDEEPKGKGDVAER